MSAAIEIVFWREPGWKETRAQLGVDGRIFGGSAREPLVAIAWSLDEYHRRTKLGEPHSMTRHPDAKPGEWSKYPAPASDERFARRPQYRSDSPAAPDRPADFDAQERADALLHGAGTKATEGTFTPRAAVVEAKKKGRKRG